MNATATDTADTTTVNGTTIIAPNSTFTDDTPNALLCRVIARINAKGLHVVGVYGGEWQTTVNREPTRQFELDVATEPGGDPLGQVLVRHTRATVFHKVRGIAFDPRHHNGVKDTTRIGWSGEALWKALGWRE